MKLEFQSKNQIVYQALLQAIVREEFKPGQRLVIDDLAQRFMISQIPIREALRQLESDGFVSFAPHFGFTVTSIHADLVAEVFALLEATEVFSSRKACQIMTSDQLEQFEQLVREMDQSVQNAVQWSQDNKRLHQFICECANVPLIAGTMRKSLDHWDRLSQHFFSGVLAHRIQIAQREHWLILDAFNRRDPDAVEKVIHQHNQSALTAYLAHLREEP